LPQFWSQFLKRCLSFEVNFFKSFETNLKSDFKALTQFWSQILQQRLTLELYFAATTQIIHHSKISNFSNFPSSTSSQSHQMHSPWVTTDKKSSSNQFIEPSLHPTNLLIIVAINFIFHFLLSSHFCVYCLTLMYILLLFFSSSVAADIKIVECVLLCYGVSGLCENWLLSFNWGWLVVTYSIVFFSLSMILLLASRKFKWVHGVVDGRYWRLLVVFGHESGHEGWFGYGIS
jgi:hypothetical protein